MAAEDLEQPCEPLNVAAFRTWLVEHGAYVHPHVHFHPVPFGFNVIARHDVPADTTVLSIPFSLAITPEISRKALNQFLKCDEDRLANLSERQLECTYVSMHWVVDSLSAEGALQHGPYIDTLPAPEKLRTPLQFSSAELQAFRGSNLYGATLDRRKDWEEEWSQCRSLIEAAKPEWGAAFTWERYLTASTYLSSRAFPSTLLSSDPSLVTTPTSHPVLLPGIDALNHARAHPVSWAVSSAASESTSSTKASISLIIHTPTPSGSELLNNYGPKPNSELILGYGFSIPNNPDDTIVLKIGGPSAPSSSSSNAPSSSSGRWEVGRNAHGAEPVWEAVLAAVCAPNADDDTENDESPSIEDELCAADMLAEMAEQLHDRLPRCPPDNAAEMRPEVLQMLEHYLEGQRDILRALIAFARANEARAMEMAREQGLDIVNEEEEEEEE